MPDICDKCNSKVVDGRCGCGVWFSNKDMPNAFRTIERAIYAFNFLVDQKQIGDVFTGDHHSGTCIALFKGSHEDCLKLKQFISNGFR